MVWHAQVEYLRQLGIVDAIIGKMIATRPQLLACDIEDWRTLVKYFQVLGVQKLGIQRILSVHPSVFCMNLEKNIAPKVNPSYKLFFSWCFSLISRENYQNVPWSMRCINCLKLGVAILTVDFLHMCRIDTEPS